MKVACALRDLVPTVQKIAGVHAGMPLFDLDSLVHVSEVRPAANEFAHLYSHDP